MCVLVHEKMLSFFIDQNKKHSKGIMHNHISHMCAKTYVYKQYNKALRLKVWFVEPGIVNCCGRKVVCITHFLSLIRNGQSSFVNYS